ncbi:hypothetical protein GT715_27895 [Clostridium beijerinckii]|uniref:Uncharacterized protein n=1 Tax=Clostridium beijerinckii TaxID=1520 RepID=A0A1S9N6F0_CLOBE|nr:hypothetical protein [Clostridium beijerinckii]MZK62156.1 hypothetical protein [Clostridium beijerinckii]MZK72373.1 hypothetical protein [Clostridium beijerinckii]MZK77767.1 hypothetical protein [Clostridium beijerinckii]MZK87342.1 hypothetical protein [Clostridium beijerinckii]
MKIKKLLIIFLIYIFTFTIITEIQPSPIAEVSEQQIFPISTTYKQGIYSLSLFDGYKVTAKLITPNTTATLITVDSNGKLIQFIHLDDTDEIVKLGTLHEGDTGIVLGNGEVSISPSK